MSTTSAPTAPVLPTATEKWPETLLRPLRAAFASKRCVVTGGCGFVGQHIAALLQHHCGAQVVVFDVVEPRARLDNVEYVRGDLLQLDDLLKAFRNAYCVFHVASPPPTCNNPTLFHNVNVNGTALVIDACKQVGCARLVLTASASVLFDGTDQRNYDETCAVNVANLDPYARSKHEGEQLVLRAASSTFFTCSIRPHGIFGPGDPHLLPAIARTGAERKNRYQIGDGSNLVDFTYVGNVAYAHVLAGAQLGTNARINGQAYLITNSEPVRFWDFFSQIYEFLGYAPPSLPLPFSMMKPLATTFEAIKRVVPSLPIPVSFTVQAVNYAGKHHYYSSRKALDDFGYVPAVPLAEALQRTFSVSERFKNKNAKPVAPRVYRRSSSRAMAAFVPLLLVVVAIVCATCDVKAWIATLSWYTLALIVLHAGLLAKFVYAQTSFGEPLVPFTETPDLSGKVAVVTGANRGLGLHTAIRLAKLRANVIVACRDQRRGAAAVTTILAAAPNARVTVAHLDLASFASVRQFVSDHVSQPIDYLIHNAGAVIPKATTVDEHDEQLQCNFLSHVLLTHSLLRANKLSPTVKIVCVSSVMHTFGTLDLSDLEARKPGAYFMYDRYNDTKLMQIAYMFAMQRWLDREYYARVQSGEWQPAVRPTIVAVNPGAVDTEFQNHYIPPLVRALIRPVLNAFITKSVEQGVDPILYAAVSKEMIGVGGVYIDNCHVAVPSPEALDRRVQEELWKQANEMCGLGSL